MGMFDWLRCECPLPGLDDPTTIRFQTKDTGAQYLELYIITKEGRLVHHRPTRYEDRSEPGARGFMALRGCMTPVEFSDEDTNYHGMLNFYGDECTGELRQLSLKPENFGQDEAHPEPTEWFEYNAKFTDGKLVDVTRATTEP